MSAFAYLEQNPNTVTLSARLIFYGTNATPELTEKIMTEIVEMYREPEANVNINGQKYAVLFDFTHEIASIEKVMSLARGNKNVLYNFVRIEEKNHQFRSFMGFGLGDNVGHWLITDQLGESTTAAHEFGHAMGLDHPAEIDFRGKGNPGIMAPRGTIVDAKLQWNPAAVAGEYGGTLYPKHRRVQAYEIQQIFDGIIFNDKGQAAIGKVSNVLFSELGEPVRVY